MFILPAKINNFIFHKSKKSKNTQTQTAISQEFSWDGYSNHAFFQFMSSKRLLQLLELQKNLGLEFDDINLLNQIFIHGSNKIPYNITHKDTYQTLEFYGDAVLSACIKRLIYENMETRNLKIANFLYGQISCNENIAKYTKSLGLDEFIISQSENKKQNADVFEALLGAIAINYKEEGFNKAYEFFKKLIDDETLNKIKNSKNETTYYKNLIMTYLDGKNANLKLVSFKDQFCDDMYISSVYYDDKKILETKAKDKLEGYKYLHQTLVCLAENDYLKFSTGKEKSDLIKLKPYEITQQANKEDDFNNDYQNNFELIKPLSNERIKKLIDFQKKYDLNFKDINLLNKALSRINLNKYNFQDYEFMTFFGKSLFSLSIIRLITENFQNGRESDMDKIRASEFNKENLTKKFYELGFDELCEIYTENLPAKTLFNIFYALYGAIYLNNKNEGFSKVYNFTKKIFEDDVKKKRQRIQEILFFA